MCNSKYKPSAEEMKNPYKSEGRRPLSRPGHRQEDNIKIVLMKINLRMWTGELSLLN
jgi:hypothetical protein